MSRHLLRVLAILLFGPGATRAQDPPVAEAAPAAAKAAKKLLGGGGMDARDMAKELARGRLELKGPRFLPGSELLEEGTDGAFTTLADALSGYSEQFVVYVSPEQEKGIEPDTSLAARRVQRAWARMIAAGVPEERIVPGGALPVALRKESKWPKLGETRIELVRRREP
jgi:hypothetical protein